MKFEWDDSKEQSNRTKHGIGFELVFDAEWEHALLIEDTRFDYGEQRFLAYVPIHKRVHAVIYADRKNSRRIISVRKANSREVQFYDRQT